ncbi:MAG: chromosomal replication initiator protein DnaA [Candidatus Moranbacteria bacterium]|nr:chromosomal replication initiator protein DnaA [Candidatus Moranbacteria bacterium]
MTNEELWQAALGEIELSISKANFITWFKNTSILSIKDGQVVISVPNGFAKEWLENKYKLYILRALRNLHNEIREVVCTITATQERGLHKPIVDAISHPKTQLSQKQAKISQESNLNPRYTFESFVVGSSNELARAACFAVSQSLGRLYNPLFIYGGVGLGKTHLLQSIGNEILRRDSGLKVRYLTSERFTNDLIVALQSGKINAFKEFYQTFDLLIIDDIQFLSGKEKTQEEFFHIFNYLYQLNKQIVLSSDRPPKAIPTLEERLRSRFEGGMIADVSRPDYETRLAILRRKALEEGIQIDEEALEFIATNITANIRELEGALNRLEATAQLSNQEITGDFALSALADLVSSGKRKGITHKHIIRVVSEFYDIEQEDLLVKGRKKEVVKPRQIAMFLMRSELNYSYPGIGERLGGRDHTTAIHAFEKITKELEVDKKLSEDIAVLKERLYSIN